jgi:galactose mutarotase-like enzyme
MGLARFSDDFSVGGLRTIRLANEHAQLALLPEVAGKIIEITDRRSGRNWMWSNPGLAPARPAYGSSFGAALDSGGWDEILLSINPERTQLPCGTHCEIPDHGDLVGQSWEVIDRGIDRAGNVFCELGSGGRAIDYRWRRRLVLDARRPLLQLEYSLENTGTAPCPWFWCAHPLIAMDDGMQIQLSPGLPFQVAAAHGLDGAEALPALRWPWLKFGTGTELDLADCFANPVSGFAAKLFFRSAAPAQVAVQTPDGSERFLLSYDAEKIPWLGLWINNRGWSGLNAQPYRNLGLEPSTAPTDSLVQAVAENQVAFIQPGERRQWSLQVSLQANPPRSEKSWAARP